jgi:hypothetical protein
MLTAHLLDSPRAICHIYKSCSRAEDDEVSDQYTTNMRNTTMSTLANPNMMLPRWIYIWAGHLAELNELFTNKMCQPHLAQAPSRAHHRDAEDAWTCDWQAVSISHMFRGLYHRKELAFVPKHTS